MTFLCEQPSFDGKHKLHTLQTRMPDAVERLGIYVKRCNPMDEDEKDLWMEVEGKAEAEEIAIKSMLDECDLVGPNWIAAGSRVATKTRRGAGNIILIGKDAGNRYNIGTQVKAIYIRDDIPEGTGIILYKGSGEIDSSFYFSAGSKKSYLYCTPEWRDYASLFDATLIDTWNKV